MEDQRNTINNLIIEADTLISSQNIEKGIEKFEEAKKLAKEIDWNDRIIQIDQMIQNIYENKHKEELRKERELELEKDKERQEEEQKKLIEEQNQQLENEKQIKLKKMDVLRQRKQEEEKISSQAYDCLEIASNAILNKDFEQGLLKFQEAKEIFQKIEWGSEVIRIDEMIKDANLKAKEYEDFKNREEIEAKKSKEHIETEQKRVDEDHQIQQQEQEIHKQKENELKKKKDFEEEISKKAYESIELMEKKIKDYENRIKRFDILSIPCPYKEAEETYREAAKQLGEIGRRDQSQLILDGAKLYIEKLKKDLRLRKIEEGKRESKTLEEQKLQDKVEVSQRIKQRKQSVLKERKEKEILRKKEEEKFADSVFTNIGEIEKIVKIFEDNPENLSLECPYPKAIQVYKTSADQLRDIGWKEQSLRLYDGVEDYKNRLAKINALKEQLKSEILEREKQETLLKQKVLESQETLKEKKQREIEEKLKEQQKKGFEQAVADQVYAQIDAIERKVKEYESHGDRVPFSPPYEEAIQTYTESSKKLEEIGWKEQSLLLKDGLKQYSQKSVQDQQYREEEKQRIAKTQEDKDMLERRAKLSKKFEEDRKRELEEKENDIIKEKSYKKSIADQIFAQIEIIEKEIKSYESKVDKIPYQCPYDDAIKGYTESAKRLAEIGWHEESMRLFEGAKAYKQKLQLDISYREEEKLKIAKTQEEHDLLEKRAILAKNLEKEKFKEIEEKRRIEKEEQAYKQSIADQVFAQIDVIEAKVKNYEVRVDRVPFTPPYEEAIKIYLQGSDTLKEIGWTEQSIRLYDGSQAYKEQDRRDRQYREEEKLRIAKTQEDRDMLERRATLAKRLEEERQKEESEKNLREKEERAYKQSIADQVFEVINQMEEKAKIYEAHVDRVPFTPPFDEIIQVYLDSAKRLAEIGWKEESLRLFDGAKAYQEKSKADKDYRSSELFKITKTKEDELQLQERAKIALQLKEEKERQESDKIKKEKEEQAYKQSIADKIFSQIDNIEAVVKEYEKHVDRVPFTPPYEKAIHLYLQGSDTLKEIGWTEQSIRLYDGAQAYRERDRRDREYREVEKLRIAKTQEDRDMLERRAILAKRLEEERQKEEANKKQRDNEEKAYKQSIADQVFELINQMEEKAKKYDAHADLVPFTPPFAEIIQVYSDSAKRLAEIGWKEESLRLFDGAKAYQEKLKADKVYREREELKIAKTQEDEQQLQKRAKLALKQKEEKERQESEKKNKEREERIRKQSIADQVFAQIESIEAKVNSYEAHADKIPFTPPYEEAVENYLEGSETLKEIGWMEQSISLYDGARSYRERDRRDREYREVEKLRIAKTQEDRDMLERRAILANRLEEERQKEKLDKKHMEEEEKSYKQSIADQVFAQIDQMEELAKTYEAHVDPIPFSPPYLEIIRVYSSSAKRLTEIGWKEESLRLFDGVKAYQEKSKADKEFREKEKLKIAKTKADELKLQERADLAQKLKEERDQHEADKLKRERDEREHKQSIADQVFAQIDSIEEKVKRYLTHVDRVPFTPPFEEAIQVYTKGSETLREIDWMEQSIRLYDGAQAYRERERQDRRYREEEKLRIAKTQEEKDMLERRATLAKNLEEERQKNESEKKRRDEEEIAFKKSIADQVFEIIDQMEEKAKIYEKYVDPIPYSPPYEEISQVYSDSAKRLAEIGWKEESSRLFDGAKAYQEKVKSDIAYRKEEEQKIAKTQEDELQLQERVKLAQQLKDEKEQLEFEKLKRGQEEQAFKQSIADKVFTQIDALEANVKIYDGYVDRVPFTPPYEEAVQIYLKGSETLKEIGWMEQSIRLYDGAQAYRERDRQDREYREVEKLRIAKTQEDRDMLERRATLAKNLEDDRQKVASEKMQREEEEKSYKQSIADQVFAQINKMEEMAKTYEDHVDIIPYSPPYEEIIRVYSESAKRLAEIGWNEESLRLYDGAKAYQEKLRKDSDYREKDRLKIAQTQEEERVLEKRARLAQELKEKREKEIYEKRKQERDENAYKQSIGDQVLAQIDAIEEKIKIYESHLDKIPYSPPYEEAIQIYTQGSGTLREIGLMEQSIRLYDGAQANREKNRRDRVFREEEKLRIAKTQEEQEMLEERTIKAQKLQDERQKQIEDKNRKKLEEQAFKKSISDQVFTQIDKAEGFAHEYASHLDPIPFIPPFEKIIEMYIQGAETLKGIGWTEQSLRLFEGAKAYKEKLQKDNNFRENEKLRIAKTNEDKEVLERRAKLAQQLETQRKEEFQRKKERDNEERAYKMSIADQVFAKVDEIEEIVDAYESHVDKIPFECPYEQVAITYTECAQRLTEIAWNEESRRLFGGAQAYRKMLKEDIEFREREKQRVAKTIEEQEMLEKRAELAKKNQQEKQEQLKEKQRKEAEENSYIQSVTSNIFKKIDSVEAEVKIYEGYPDKIPYSAPYEKAIEIYIQGSETLKEIGWTEQSISLYDGAAAYRERLRRDRNFREEEKLRIVKTKEDQKMLKNRAQLAEKLQTQHEKELKAQIQKQEQEKAKISKEAEKIFAEIEKIEILVGEYEGHANRLPYPCPYEKAIKFYLDFAQKFEEIGWVDEGLKIYEGAKTYQEKLRKDTEFRDRSAKRQETQTQNALELQKRIEMSQKQIEEKIKSENLEKKKEKEIVQQHKELSDVALKLISEGNDYVKSHAFKSAIMKYLEAGSLFKQIGWKSEAERTYNQIELFKQDEINYQNELRRQDDERINKLKELEELDKRAKISWMIKQKEQLEIEQQKKLREEEKRKKDLDDIQQLISESQKIKEIESQKLQKQKEEEARRAAKIQNFHNDCLMGLDKARKQVEDKNFTEAIAMYTEVLHKYKQFNYFPGIRLTQDTIEKTKNEFEAHEEQIRLKKLALQQRDAEIERINRLLQKSQEESERKQLEEQKRQLVENEIRTQEERIQNQIIDLMEMGSNYSLQLRFDNAVEKYENALELLEQIQWPLKKKQIQQLIEDVVQKKDTYLVKFEQLRKRQEEENLQRDNFEKQMAEQDVKRQEFLESYEQYTLEQRKLAQMEKKRGDFAYEYLGLAETEFEEQNPYLSIYYLHNAMFNFAQNRWKLEANTTKKRLKQIFESIEKNVVHLPEILANSNFEAEKQIMENISQVFMAMQKENITSAIASYEVVTGLATGLKWDQTVELLNDLENDIYALKAKIEHRASLPTKEDGFELLNSAQNNLKIKDFAGALSLTQNAAEIFNQINMFKQRHLCDQNLLRYKLMLRKQQNMLTLAQKIKQAMTPEGRRLARIESRKIKRRNSRKRRSYPKI
ncbi:MAG: hypothetical protein ACTSRK_14800 [Promethearchaeota archaeon]